MDLHQNLNKEHFFYFVSLSLVYYTPRGKHQPWRWREPSQRRPWWRCSCSSRRCRSSSSSRSTTAWTSASSSPTASCSPPLFSVPSRSSSRGILLSSAHALLEFLCLFPSLCVGEFSCNVVVTTRGSKGLCGIKRYFFLDSQLLAAWNSMLQTLVSTPGISLNYCVI